MGYCSEVVFSCSYEDYLLLDQELKDKGFDLFERTSDSDKFELDNKPWIWLRWDYIKWYTDRDDIQVLIKYMKNFDNQYQFMRLGEDPDDEPEVINTTDDRDWFDVYRTIEVNI